MLQTLRSREWTIALRSRLGGGVVGEVQPRAAGAVQRCRDAVLRRDRAERCRVAGPDPRATASRTCG